MFDYLDKKSKTHHSAAAALLLVATIKSSQFHAVCHLMHQDVFSPIHNSVVSFKIVWFDSFGYSQEKAEMIY